MALLVPNPLVVFIRQHRYEHLLNAAQQFIALNFQQAPADLQIISQYVSLPGPNLFYRAQIQSNEWIAYLLVGADGVEDARGLSILMANQNASQNCGRPSDFRHFSILPELHCFVARDHYTIHRRCLIYPEFRTSEFRTLSEWIDEKEANLQSLETNLQSLMRDYLLGLHDIHSTDMRCHGEISQASLIVYNGKGMFLQPKSLHGMGRVTTPMEFKNLGDALHAIFDPRAWYQPDTRIHNLILFVKTIKDVEGCMWVKYAPFILKPREIMDFIPHIQGMSKKNGGLKTTLENAAITWTPAVATMSHAPLTTGFTQHGPRNGKKWPENFFHLLRFLRNSIAHLNDKVPVTSAGDTRAEYSSMKLKASSFMRFVSIIEGIQTSPVNVMDFIFYDAVKANCLIEDLDSNLLA